MREEWNEMEIRDVKKKVERNGVDRWQEGMSGKSSLKWYARKQKPEGVAWHVGDWGSKLLFKARSGTLEVNGMNRDGGSQGDGRTTNYDRHRGELGVGVEAVLGREE